MWFWGWHPVGAHSNGYSLIRKIIEKNSTDLSADFHGKALIDVIMAPTRIYVKPVLELMNNCRLKGMAHITGGGLVENIPRVLPKAVTAVLQKNMGYASAFSLAAAAGQCDETVKCTACSIAASAWR